MVDILQYDRQLFELINTHWSNDFFDILLPLFREKLVWAPFYVFLLAYALVNLGTKRWYFILFLFGTVALSDLTSSELIKKSIQRHRPCQEIANFDQINVRVHCGSGFSFTSSHAANHFAIALFLVFTVFRQTKWVKFPLVLWAFTISYAQVYVGVHYPLDILGGTIVGAIYAFVMSWLYINFTGSD